MLLLTSTDNGKTWLPARVMLESTSGQFDPQIAIDPVDRHTLYAAWLQDKKRTVMVGKSADSGATWAFTMAVRSDEELDKPALAVRGQNVYAAFNHEEEVWVASSQDGGRSFVPARVNAESRPGWSLLGGASVDPTGNVYLGWASYSKSGGARGASQLICRKIGGCWQDMESHTARRFCRGSRVQRRRMCRRVSRCASFFDFRRRWNPLRALERGAAKRCRRSEFIFRLQPMAAKTGCRGSAYLPRSPAWNMLSRRSLQATPATSESRGWTNAILLIGIPTTKVPATVALRGEMRSRSQAMCRAIVTSASTVFVFRLAIISGWRLTITATRTWCGGEGLNYQSPGSIWAF